jgi:hypothetical protein
METIKRIFAAAIILAVSSPAFAQYPYKDGNSLVQDWKAYKSSSNDPNYFAL